MKVFFLFILSLNSFSTLSSKEQYHGFFEREKEEILFDTNRKKGLNQHKEELEIYRKEQKRIQTKEMKKDRKPKDNSSERAIWEKKQALQKIQHEKNKKAYLKERSLARREESLYQRPQSIPYKPPSHKKSQTNKPE